LGRGRFFFFCQPAEEAALVLRDGLSAKMEMLLSSVSFLLLLLLICGDIGDEKDGSKVNRAEENVGKLRPIARVTITCAQFPPWVVKIIILFP
jgi:hypothetical protein